MRSPVPDFYPEVSCAFANALPLGVDAKKDRAHDRIVEQLGFVQWLEKKQRESLWEWASELLPSEVRKLRRMVRKFNARYGHHA